MNEPLNHFAPSDQLTAYRQLLAQHEALTHAVNRALALLKQEPPQSEAALLVLEQGLALD